MMTNKQLERYEDLLLTLEQDFELPEERDLAIQFVENVLMEDEEVKNQLVKDIKMYNELVSL